MFDTHAHLNFEIFEGKTEEILAKAEGAGVKQILVCGTDLKSSQKAWELSQKYPPLFASAGIHPHHIFNYLHSHNSTVILGIRQLAETPESDPGQVLRSLREPEDSSEPRTARGTQDRGARMTMLEKDLRQLESLLTEEKVVAVGEVGLDKHQYQNTKYENYHNGEEFLDLQKQVFIAQIHLAVKYQKSLVIHSREAKDEMLKILEENWHPKLAGRTVFHCCEPEEELLAFAQNHHIFIGVDGDITYRKSKQEFIKKVPLKLLVLETDSPYLLPQSLKDQGETINQPANLAVIAEEVAKILGISVEKLAQTTHQNSQKLFAIS